MNRSLFANIIDCLTSRILAQLQLVHRLVVFACYELPRLASVKRSYALILKSDSKAKPGQHLFAIFWPKKI